ncbi:MAG TPA: M15 family metallopeptidase, partial [Thermomicrobiaceae bacterium]|nr:M15 family metallopeptidase [Thermomicrobiaceae bacterium]
TAPFQPLSAQSDASCTFFPPTGHRLCFGFRGYWQTHGGLEILGYPISEEFRQNGVTVQYFERARLEYHPENAAPWDIEGGLLGSQVLASTGQVVPPVAPPVFAAAINPVSDSQQRAMLATGSWRTGCPVSIGALRVLDLSYWGFDGGVHTGQLMVNADVAQPVVQAFRLLFAARYPVHRMELVEQFNADDEQSMLADNTSAFNCRGVPGSSAWSQHAYGRAVDLNPFENPEVRNGAVDPPAAAVYTDRSLSVTGMLHPGDAAVQAFATIGWTWGGDWTALKDYMHFSLTGE